MTSKASNNKTPIDIKNKFPYINKQRARFAKQFNIPIHKAGAPPNFPAMTLYVQRILAALTIIEPSQDVLVKAVDALYKAYWVEHTDVSKPENHLRVIAGAVGEDLCKKAAELAPKEGKALVLKNSEQAFNDGAFGLPWMYCTDSKGEKEGFWGVDQMGQVCEFLEIDRPKQGGWKAVL